MTQWWFISISFCFFLFFWLFWGFFLYRTQNKELKNQTRECWRQRAEPLNQTFKIKMWKPQEFQATCPIAIKLIWSAKSMREFYDTIHLCPTFQFQKRFRWTDFHKIPTRQQLHEQALWLEWWQVNWHDFDIPHEHQHRNWRHQINSWQKQIQNSGSACFYLFHEWDRDSKRLGARASGLSSHFWR